MAYPKTHKTYEAEIKPEAHSQRAGAAVSPAGSGLDKWTAEGARNERPVPFQYAATVRSRYRTVSVLALCRGGYSFGCVNQGGTADF